MAEDFPDGARTVEGDLQAQIAAEMRDPAMIGEMLPPEHADLGEDQPDLVGEPSAGTRIDVLAEPIRDEEDHATAIAEGGEHHDEADPVPIAPTADGPTSQSEPRKAAEVLAAADGFTRGDPLPSTNDMESYRATKDAVITRGRIDDLKTAKRAYWVDETLSDEGRLETRRQIAEVARSKAKAEGRTLNSELTPDASRFAATVAHEALPSEKQLEDRRFDARHMAEVYHWEGQERGYAGYERRYRGALENYKQRIEEVRTGALAMYDRDPARYKDMPASEFLDIHKEYVGEEKEAIEAEKWAAKIAEGAELVDGLDVTGKSLPLKDIRAAMYQGLGRVCETEESLSYPFMQAAAKVYREVVLGAATEMFADLPEYLFDDKRPMPPEEALQHAQFIDTYAFDRFMADPDRTPRESAQLFKERYSAFVEATTKELGAIREAVEKKYGPEPKEVDLMNLAGIDIADADSLEAAAAAVARSLM